MTDGGNGSAPGAVVIPALYPDPPVKYTDVDILVLVPPAPIPIALPDGLSPAGGIGVLMLADYPSSDLGAYREAFVLVAAFSGSQLVWFCPLIYVTSDAALAAGREIWGFPKRLADISLDIADDGGLKAAIHRDGATLEVTGALTVDLDTENVAAPKDPIVNVRTIPAVDGGAPDVKLTAVNFDFALKHARGGTADLRTTSGPADPLAELFGTADGCAISVFRADAVLPYGRVLES